MSTSEFDFLKLEFIFLNYYLFHEFSNNWENYLNSDNFRSRAHLYPFHS